MNELAGWPALILTAGLATRLRPVSDVRAKAAIPIAGKPLVGRILEWLRAAGVRDVVLNLHHRPETLTRLVGDGAQWDVVVRYSWEPQVLGSAGGPRRAVALLDTRRFLIVNGDTLTDCDLSGLVQRHLETGARVTMAVIPGDVGRYGGVQLAADGGVTGFARASSPASAAMDPRQGPTSPGRCRHFIGVQAVNADIFDDVRDDEPCETVRTLYPRLIAGDASAITAFETNAEFHDVGTAADYHRTVATFAAREGKPFDTGEGCQIDRAADVQRTVIWDRVVVSPDTQLINCIVTDDVCVPAGERFESCAIVVGSGGLIVRSF